jgi:hypothetical protein
MPTPRDLGRFLAPALNLRTGRSRLLGPQPITERDGIQRDAGNPRSPSSAAPPTSSRIIRKYYFHQIIAALRAKAKAPWARSNAASDIDDKNRRSIFGGCTKFHIDFILFGGNFFAAVRVTLHNAFFCLEDIAVDQGDNTKSTRHYLAWLFCGLILAAIVSYGMNQYSRPTTVAQTTSVPSQVPASGPVNPNSQASPQGPTGPLETKSGGAPASSPQGETPPGMQSAPQGSGEKTTSLPK